ncbi:cobalt-precorrin 5A hydrolase [Desulfobacterales bacterium HSG16]|nr:cobalt-precorrin 5A hydrolase [Desulfobacterales bacterium HSG16]
MKNFFHDKLIAVWAVTPEGANLASLLSSRLESVILKKPHVYLPAKLCIAEKNYPDNKKVIRFERLSHAVSEYFHEYQGHIFIMAAGIVVRMIAPSIRHKTVDPAVVVMDEAGRYAISLLSGHIGGANNLAGEISKIIGAVPIITTATDVNGVMAIDVMAMDKNLVIENPEAIKHVNMALITKSKIMIHDPFDIMAEDFCDSQIFVKAFPDKTISDKTISDKTMPGIYIDHRTAELPEKTLVLRPKTLFAGIGCNRNTDKKEMRSLLSDVLARNSLSPGSLAGLASIDLKSDEKGLIELGEELDLPISFFEKDRLNSVKKIETPSDTVEKYVGVKSVCEAAAILAAGNGRLIVPKQKTPNVTVAIAVKMSSISWE